MSMNRELCPSMKTSPNDTPTGAIDIDNSNIWKKRQMVPPAGHTIALQKIPTISKNDSNDVFKKKNWFFCY